MKTIVGLMLVFMLMIVAAPAYSAEVVQIYDCEQDEDATDEAIKSTCCGVAQGRKENEGW